MQIVKSICWQVIRGGIHEKKVELDEFLGGMSNDEKYIYSLISKQHDYFRDKDRRYRKVVKSIKVSILTLSMSGTVVLGLKTVINIDVQV